MTGGQLLIAGGMLAGLGAVWAVAAVRRARPSLAGALAQLAADPAAPDAPDAAPVRPGGVAGWLPGRWPAAVAARLPGRLGVTEQDLAVLGMTREQLAARKLALGAAGLLAPALIGVAMAAAGLGAVAALPGVAGIAVAAVGWLLPSQEARERAGAARVAFTVNVAFFCKLVAAARRARGSVEQALSEAAGISGTAPFLAIRRVIVRAELAGQKPWAGLSALGERLGVEGLREVADTAAVAADGAAVYETLRATGRTLDRADRARRLTEANNASERMARPLGLLVFGLVLFVMVPFLLRMFGAI